MREGYKQAIWVGAAAAGALIGARAVSRRVNAYSFRGKVALITGGSRGLGLVIARQLADEGARLAICARDEAELERAREQLAASGAEVLSVPCDVTDNNSVKSMMRSVEQRYGRVDLLINNAGIIAVGPLDSMREEDYRQAMDTHFWGPLHTMLAAVPGMKERGEGRIVNIASIGGKIAVPHLTPYSASKFALVGLSRGFRAELAGTGVIVTTICPGLMRTGSPINAEFKGQHREEYAWFSISDSLPLASMSSERAAHQVLNAARRGDAEVILTTQAKLAAKLDALFPELGADILALANRILPEYGGIGTEARSGAESESELTQSWATRLSREAALRNNET
jgi:NAD(P)-dependent dehydrogenase (short-subunit alcohol dehydrogenase family)